jgi:hypothetical protein
MIKSIMMTAEATNIGCPDCAGALQAEYGPHGHIQFSCSVGHAYSKEELYQAKEGELERTLWSATALLEHLRIVFALFKGRPSGIAEDDIQRRLQQIDRHKAKVRAIIEETSLAIMKARHE